MLVALTSKPAFHEGLLKTLLNRPTYSATISQYADYVTFAQVAVSSSITPVIIQQAVELLGKHAAKAADEAFAAIVHPEAMKDIKKLGLL